MARMPHSPTTVDAPSSMTEHRSEPAQTTQDAPVAPRRMWANLAAMLVVALGVLAVLVRVAIHSWTGLDADRRMMESLGRSEAAALRITDVMTYITVAGVAVCLAACIVVALSRRRYSLALGAVVLIGGANVTTQLLKYQVFDRVDGQHNHLPSGHTTVAVSVGLAAVLVAPAAWRWFIVPLAGFVGTFVGAGTVVGWWHTPADVLAAVAVCLGWAALAIGITAVLQRTPAEPHRASAVRSSLALPGAALVGACFVAWGVRPHHGDVNLAMASVALVGIGLCVAAVVAWTSAVAERYLR